MTEQTESNLLPTTARPPSAGKRDRRHELGPHSRLFNRGAIGDMDGNSAGAKFIRTVERAVLDYVGGPAHASLPQKLLAVRIAKIAYRLELFDRKIETGSITDHDARVFGSLHNSYRLMLRELKPAAAHPGAALDAHLAKLAARVTPSPEAA